MATKQTNLAGFFKDGLAQARAKWVNVEEEGQKVVTGLVERTRASRAEMSSLVGKLYQGELFNPKKVKALQKQARHLGADLSHRVVDLRAQVIEFAGVADRGQVEDLAKTVDRLARKVERLASVKKAVPGGN